MIMELSRGQRAKLHVGMQEALDVPPERTNDLQQVKLQAYCEAVCWAESPGEVLLLALKIEGFIDDALREANAEYATVDQRDLRCRHGETNTSIALRLAGVCPVIRENKIVWTTAPGDEQTVMVSLPSDLNDG